MSLPALNKRDKDIFDARRAGATFVRLAEKYKMSPSRARQIFLRMARHQKLLEETSKMMLRRHTGIDPLDANPFNILLFSVRARYLLKAHGITTIRQLVATNPRELLNLRNFGHHSLRSIQSGLKQLNIDWKSTNTGKDSS